jgi:hypothetical protein
MTFVILSFHYAQDFAQGHGDGRGELRVLIRPWRHLGCKRVWPPTGSCGCVRRERV